MDQWMSWMSWIISIPYGKAVCRRFMLNDGKKLLFWRPMAQNCEWRRTVKVQREFPVVSASDSGCTGLFFVSPKNSRAPSRTPFLIGYYRLYIYIYTHMYTHLYTCYDHRGSPGLYRIMTHRHQGFKLHWWKQSTRSNAQGETHRANASNHY